MEFYAFISNHTFQRILRDMGNAYHIALGEKAGIKNIYFMPYIYREKKGWRDH